MSDKVGAVPYLDLTSEYEALESQWLAAIAETGHRGSYILGPNVQAFEQEAAAWLGCTHAVSVANGTDALVLSLRALGIGPGDEVITSPYTFFATAEAIDLVGGTPVFADILPDSFCLDPASVATRVSAKTRAILPVHIFGYPADMTSLRAIADEHGLRLVEDFAQAFGARHGKACVGSLGDAGCTSFYPTKVLGCYGDGGLITTNDESVDAHLRKLRNHGATAPFMHDEIGTNSRLDEIQAALLRLKLRSLEQAIAGRHQVAASYARLLAGKVLALPSEPGAGQHAFNLYTIRVNRRDALREFLQANGVATSLCYPLPLHLQQVYAHLGYQQGDLPVAEQASREALSLPIYPGMPESHIERVCGLVAEFG